MITKENLFYGFSSELKPVLRVSPGEVVVIETVDAFGGQITSENDVLDSLDWSKVNPATGPIYIEGAEKGDLLKVIVHSIETDTVGVMASIPGAGVFGSDHNKSSIKLFQLENDMTAFNDMVIPLNPMIGVIGVAPEEGVVNNGEPGPHGGNMDNRLITVGTMLYLPVFHEGAIFGLGDLHACMGDGEVNVTGIEVGGKVTLSFEIIKKKSHGHPLMIKEGRFYTIYSSQTLDDAIIGATYEMHYWLQQSLKYNHSDTAMLLSLMGHTEICQVVDPLKTARFRMPSLYFRSQGL